MVANISSSSRRSAQAFRLVCQVCTWLDYVLLSRGLLQENNVQCGFIALSPFYFLLQMNCNVDAQAMFRWSFYNAVMHVLSSGSPFKMFSCFLLGNCIVSCAHASTPAEGSKRSSLSRKVSGNYNYENLWDYLDVYSVDGIVNYSVV